MNPHITIRFVPQDLWIGLYWKTGVEGSFKFARFYLCIIPTLPIILTLYRSLPAPMPKGAIQKGDHLRSADGWSQSGNEFVRGPY